MGKNEGSCAMISTILWDVDGTLLDFLLAEKVALQGLFPRFGLGVCTDALIKQYSAINLGYWERLERGELSREQVMVGRYEEFFRTIGQDPGKAAAFNEAYQVALGQTAVCRDDSYTILASLRGRLGQYAVSNGTEQAQTAKLRNSGLDRLMDGIFLSERLGVEKPGAEFFEKVFAAIGERPREQVLIVGDSLTSDIRGGINAGLRTCWYNPDHKENHAALLPEWEIDDLHTVYDILSLENGVDYRPA